MAQTIAQDVYVNDLNSLCACLAQPSAKALHIGPDLTDGNAVAARLAANRTCVGRIEVDPANPALEGIGGMLFSKHGTGLLFCPGGEYGEICIPEGAKFIHEGAMAGVRADVLRIPGSMQVIGTDAFLGSTFSEAVLGEGLRQVCPYEFVGATVKKLRLPGSMRAIHASAFNGCQVEEAEFNDSLERIGQDAFSGCRLAKVCLPPSVSLEGGCLGDSVRWVEMPGGPVKGLLSIIVNNHAWEPGHTGHPIVMEVYGERFAFPSEIPVDNEFYNFRLNWRRGRVDFGYAKKAYKHASTQGLKEDTALAALMLDAGDAEARELVRKAARGMVQRYVDTSYVDGIMSLIRAGMAPADALAPALCLARDNTEKAYMLDELKKAGVYRERNNLQL